MSEAFKGVVAMVAVCVIFGFSPLFYKLLVGVPALEVLIHRTVWSLVFLGIVLLVQRRLGEVARLVAGPSVGRVALAAVIISVNWGLYIYAIQIDRVVESSLGYYIFPLIAVVLGMLVFGERLGRVQWVSVGLAVVAVLVLTIGLGVAPWISLALAISFAVYGVLKKQSEAGPVVSVTAEVLILAPVALLWLGFHGGGVFGDDLRVSLLLMAAGPLTAVPLIMLSQFTVVQNIPELTNALRATVPDE